MRPLLEELAAVLGLQLVEQPKQVLLLRMPQVRVERGQLVQLLRWAPRLLFQRREGVPKEDQEHAAGRHLPPVRLPLHGTPDEI